MRRIDRAGVTLVEILVAAGLLALVLIPVLTLSTSNTRKMAVSHYHLQAQICARQVVTAMACRPYGELAGQVGSTSLPGLEVPEGFPGRLTLTIKDAGAGSVPQSVFPRMLEVAVTVTWSPYGKSRSEGSGSVTLSRFVSVPELGLVQPQAVNS